MDDIELLKNIDLDNLPHHVGIILDGNGRYAKSLNKPRTYGHYMGVENLKKLIPFISKLGIKELSLYCFSTENFNRPKEEVDYLMNLFLNTFNKKIKNDLYNIRIIGELDNLSEDIINIINKVNNNFILDSNKLTVNICFNYGSHSEIIDAVNNILKNKLTSITESDFNKYLKIHTPLDLLIRTGKEKRLSNFLLYQASYSELYFTDVYFPLFDEEEFIKAIIEYQGRTRRFGGLK